MAAKNSLKSYRENAFYHLYNRGVAKQNIYEGEEDYKVFISYLKLYLSSVDLQERILKVSPSRQLNNYHGNVSLLTYCLMPNHFHLLVFQKGEFGIRDFMRSLGIKYSMYFNRKNNRVGSVFQGRYKAVEVKSEEQLLYLSKYIHRNPVDIMPSRTDLEGYKYSSYGNYLGKFKQSWLKTNEILNYFSREGSSNSYRNFVEESEEGELRRIKDLTIDI